MTPHFEKQQQQLLEEFRNLSALNSAVAVQFLRCGSEFNEEAADINSLHNTVQATADTVLCEYDGDYDVLYGDLDELFCYLRWALKHTLCHDMHKTPDNFRLFGQVNEYKELVQHLRDFVLDVKIGINEL